MAEKGTQHFTMQRASAMVLIPLTIWFVYALITHAGDSHADLMAWIGKHPFSAALPMAAFVMFAFFHGRLGVADVIDDYIHNPNSRSMLHFLNTLVALILGAAAVWSIIAIAFIV